MAQLEISSTAIRDGAPYGPIIRKSPEARLPLSRIGSGWPWMFVDRVHDHGGAARHRPRLQCTQKPGRGAGIPSPPAKLAADERDRVTPVGVTQPAQCTDLKCVGPAWRQIRNGYLL